jgi:hypothetical protein
VAFFIGILSDGRPAQAMVAMPEEQRADGYGIIGGIKLSVMSVRAPSRCLLSDAVISLRPFSIAIFAPSRRRPNTSTLPVRQGISPVHALSRVVMPGVHPIT